MKFFYVLTIIGAIVGALYLIGGLSLANGAPQEAAVAAIAIACAVLPYCLARALHGMSAISAFGRLEDEQKRQTTLLASSHDPSGSDRVP